MELFGLAAADEVVGQGQRLQQRHDVDAAGLQHRALGQRDLVQRELWRACSRPWSRGRQGSSRARGRRPRPAADRCWPAAAACRPAGPRSSARLRSIRPRIAWAGRMPEGRSVVGRGDTCRGRGFFMAAADMAQTSRRRNGPQVPGRLISLRRPQRPRWRGAAIPGTVGGVRSVRGCGRKAYRTGAMQIGAVRAIP